MDIEVRYVIETRDSVEAGEYAGSFCSYDQALRAAQTWRMYQGKYYCIRPRILPSLWVNPVSGGLRFVGGTF